MQTPEEIIFANRRMQTPLETKAFDAALQAAGNAANLDLKTLVRSFDDGCVHHEVMWGLIHLLEAQPLHRYVSVFIAEAPVLAGSGREWMETILARLLNDGSTAAVVATEIRAAPPEARLVLRPILVTLAKSKAPCAQRANALVGISA